MSDVETRFVVQKGPDPGAVFAISEDVVGIGRSAVNAIAISDPEISRQHAQLIRQGDGYAIQDLGSTNGTFVNYRRIAGLTTLRHGDIVSLGEAVVLTYRDKPEQKSQPVPPPRLKPQPAPDAFPETGPIIQPVPPPEPAPAPQYYAPPPEPPPQKRRRWLLGCGLGFLIIICLCMGAVFFLDSYEQGRYLYCGVLRPFWQLILGPFGFSPAC